jgi:hypothetical protein
MLAAVNSSGISRTQAGASRSGPASTFWAISRSDPLTRSVCQRKKAIRFAGPAARRPSEAVGRRRRLLALRG